jgi:hypothetical protein
MGRMKPFKYDSSKDSGLSDVVKETSEALEAVSEAVEAAVDAIGDSKAWGWFMTKLGYRLHDGSQNVTVMPDVPTKAERTEWVETQIKAGLVVEVDPPKK